MHPVTLFFEPLDVLVFRDHRPFMAGQHFLARGVYPLPSVFFGALRAALFERAGARFGKPKFGLEDPPACVLGDADDPGQLELRGPLLARRDDSAPLTVYYPWPHDLDIGPVGGPDLLTVHPVTPAHDRPAGLRWRCGADGPAMLALDRPLPTSTRPPGKPVKQRHYLTAEGAASYARASASGEPSFQLSAGQHFCAAGHLIIQERRTGIARTRADEGVDPLTVDESMLFTVETWRLAPRVGFAIDVGLSQDARQHEDWLRAQLRALDGVTLRLGGKGHLARVHLVDHPLLAGLDRALPRLAADPSITYKAWNLTPSLLDPARTPSTTIVLGDVIRLGGVNLRAGKDRNGKVRKSGPRPLIGALAPGAILFDEGSHDPNALARQIDAAHERGEVHGHFRRAGYGIHRLLPYRRPVTGSSQ